MSSTMSSSYYRASLLDPPAANPSIADPNTPTTSTTSTPQRPAPTRRFSSASVIAQITLLGYPPKIQPQSSATRDQGRQQQQFLLQQSSPIIDHHGSSASIPTTCSPLDALDEEAGCILIALANHDPTNNKKLQPTTASTAKIMTADAVSTTSTASSSSTSTTSSDNSPSSTSIKSSLATQNGNSMSIRNLLGGGNSNNSSGAGGNSNSSDHAAELAMKPSQYQHPEGSGDSKNGTDGHVTWQKDDENDDEEDDPIMILAAAAAAINDQDQGKRSLYDAYGYDQHHHYEETDNVGGNGSSRSKRKWQGYQYMVPDDYPPANGSAEIHTDKRHRYQAGSSAQESTWRDETNAGGNNNPSGNTKDAFSWQYLSMKQNPRIKRNAMHAYITYMIYTDMTQTQAVNTLKRQDTSKLALVAASNSNSSNRPRDSAAAAIASPPQPAPTTNGRFSPPPLSTQQQQQQQQQQQGSATYRFQLTTGNDEDYIYGSTGDRAPPHKSEIPPTAATAKSSNSGSSTPYPTASHAEVTMPYPAENTANAGASTTMPSEWYHRHRSPYYSSTSGANTNDPTTRMASTAIVDRPLTAFLWDEPPKPMTGARQDGGIALPPLSSTPFPSSSSSPRV